MKELNFSNPEYLNIALNLKLQEDKVHTPEEAFLLVIKGLPFGMLDNLCNIISLKYNISVEESYRIIQNSSVDKNIKIEILDIAYECLKAKETLGTETTQDGKFNLSSWMGHLLNMGLAAKILASYVGSNPDVAQTMGIMHDYGRKYSHKFDHTIIGFEKLVDIGWNNEAIGCLTHSFVNGGRCANNEPSIEGFRLTSEDFPYFEDGIKKDDVTVFLENYQYNIYDKILNAADLIATSKGILPVNERLKDISSRRVIDPMNRQYFLKETVKLLNEIMIKSGKNIENSLDKSIDKSSNEFYEFFNKKQKENQKKKI